MLMTDTAALRPTRLLPPATWALIALAMLAPLALYFPTAVSIVDIWNSSETFAHGYVIVPISLWLVWRRRANFATFPPQPFWPAVVLLAGAGALWLAGRIGGVQFVTQYAFAAMFPLVALAVLGRRLAMSLAFPLLFLLFAVPFGEVFIGPLIEFTADFTVAALKMTGIPVLRNGTRFEIPTGSWSVVTACSGVRYLISSVTIGCLYAYLTYRSTSRRLLFVAVSIIAPIIANGLRAYMIVMIGHTSNMELATGVDHLVYGWVFFGIVMFLMFWAGSYWREDQIESAPPAVAVATDAPAPARLLPIVLACLALSALWPAFALYNDKANHNPAPVRLAAPVLAGTQAAPFTAWRANFMTPDARFDGVVQAGPVALSVLYYRNQDRSKSLVSSINTLAAEGDAYHQVAQRTQQVDFNGAPLVLREAEMSGPDGTFLVWYWYWIDGRNTASDSAGKLIQARAKLLFRGDDGAAIMLAAPYKGQSEEARTALRAFVQQNGGAIAASLNTTRGR